MDQIYFFSMLTLAVLVSRTRYKKPFLWMETFFHEFSHGLAALFTFGWISRIEIKWNGAGCCWTRGGLRIPILLAGYTGAVTWGAIIFLAGWRLNTIGDVFLFQILIGTLIFCIIMWVRDLQTLLIMLTMIAVFYIPTLFPNTALPAYAIEFYGIYIVQSAISAPLDLIDGKHEGDGAELADIFLILPEGVWIAGWFLYALTVLFWLWQIIIPATDRFMENYPYLPII